MKTKRSYSTIAVALSLLLAAPTVSAVIFPPTGSGRRSVVVDQASLNQTVSQPTLQLPATDSLHDLIEYLTDFLPVTVFPPSPAIDRSQTSFNAYGKYSHDSIERYRSALVLLFERFSSTANPKLAPLAQSIIQGHMEKANLLKTIWSSIFYDFHQGRYAQQYLDHIVGPIRTQIVDLIKDLKFYAEKYEPLDYIPDREAALAAIRDNPELVAKGLEQQLLDVEQRLEEAKTSAKSTTDEINDEVEATRRAAAARIEEIQGELNAQITELERIKNEAKGQHDLVEAAEIRLKEISSTQEQIAEKIARLAQSVEKMFAANEFGATNVSGELVSNRSSFVEKRMKAFVAAVEAEASQALEKSIRDTFGAEARIPNIKIYMLMMNPNRHRRFFVTTGFSGTLMFRVNIYMGLGVRDSINYEAPVLFSSGQLSSESKTKISEFIVQKVAERMKAAQTAYMETETTQTAVMECLSLLRELQPTASLRAGAEE